MSSRFANPDGTMRLTNDRRLLRTRPIDPVIVETYELAAPWQQQADEWIAARLALQDLFPPKPYRTVKVASPNGEPRRDAAPRRAPLAAD